MAAGPGGTEPSVKSGMHEYPDIPKVPRVSFITVAFYIINAAVLLNQKHFEKNNKMHFF